MKQRDLDRDTDVRNLILALTPKARVHLRNVLIRDQADRDEISSRLIRYRDQNGNDWADIVDFLTGMIRARRDREAAERAGQAGNGEGACPSVAVR